MSSTTRCQGSENMGNGFESELGKSISGEKKERKILGKAWISLALGAFIIASSAMVVSAKWTGGENGAGVDNGDQDQIRDPELNPDCICDCDGVCDNDADGDGICDDKED